MLFSQDYVIALGLTIAVEALIVHKASGTRGRGLLLDVVLVNLLTHPLAWQLLASGRTGFLAAEGAVVVVEALGYACLGRRSLRRAFGLAFAANLVTALLGAIWSWSGV